MKRIFLFFLLTVFSLSSLMPEANAWEETLTLWDCYERALKRSETVAIEKEEIKEAEAQLFLAASEALGEVNFEMTDSRQQQRAGGDSSRLESALTDPARRERKFVVTQPLFQGFKAIGALTGAGSLKKGKLEEWHRAQQLLFLDVARAFYGLLREEEELRTIEGIQALFQERIEELEEREQIGRSRASEVATAKARMEIIEAEYSRTRGRVRVSRHVLEFLTGISLEGFRLQEEGLPEETPREIVRYLESAKTRSDVKAAHEAVKTAWRAVLVAQSSFWPEISLEHNQYLRREGVQSEIDWDLLFKIDLPLFKGGETLGKVKEALSRWRQEKLAYSLAKRKAELEVKESHENWIASLREIRALRRALRASQENFRLQKEEYERNLVSNLDVLEALETLFQTHREFHWAHYQMKENYWQLRVASGEIP